MARPLKSIVRVPAKNAEELPLGGVKMCGGFLAGGDQLGIDAATWPHDTVKQEQAVRGPG